jgi:hypothetical protein
MLAALTDLTSVQTSSGLIPHEHYVSFSHVKFRILYIT